MIIRSLIELAAIVALVYGFAHEEKIAAWEQKFWHGLCRECSEHFIKEEAR